LCPVQSGNASHTPRRGLREWAFALRQFMGIQIGGGIQCRSFTKRRSG
jgi:hypothetical protein